MKSRFILAAALASTTAVVLTACGSDSQKSTGSSSGGAAATVASQLVFGGPAQFKTRTDGIMGLKNTYGIEFKTVQTTDIGGPVTVNALKSGRVDVADLFSTDPAIKANGFVILKDTKSNFGAQNIVPLVNKAKATSGVKKTLDAVSAKLTTDGLQQLRTEVETNKRDPVQVAKEWLKANGLDASGSNASGVKLTVGSAAFPENFVLANIYAEALKAQGATITVKGNIGERSKYYPALKDGQIDLIPEYTGSILVYLDKTATATTSKEVDAALAKALPATLIATTSAEAQDSDAIVVTKQTATKYNLASIEDLAKKG